ncbi:unnamed protein product [Brassica oleracea]
MLQNSVDPLEISPIPISLDLFLIRSFRCLDLHVRSHRFL